MRLAPAALTVCSRSAGRVFSLWACPPSPYRPRGRPRWASGAAFALPRSFALGRVTPRLLDGSIQVKRGSGEWGSSCDPSRGFSLAAPVLPSPPARPSPRVSRLEPATNQKVQDPNDRQGACRREHREYPEGHSEHALLSLAVGCKEVVTHSKHACIYVVATLTSC
jgi:hypothetical protein